MKNSFLLSTMAEKYDHFFYEEIKGEYIDFHEQWWGTVRLQRTMMCCLRFFKSFGANMV